MISNQVQRKKMHHLSDNESNRFGSANHLQRRINQKSTNNDDENKSKQNMTKIQPHIFGSSLYENE
jgi:hypothetical protein